MVDGDYQGNDTGNKAVRRQTVINGRVTGAATVTNVASLTQIGDLNLDLFDEILVYIDVTTALLATGPDLILFLQKAVVPNPVFTTDAHWDDFYALGGLNAVQQKVIQLPLYRSDAAGASASGLAGGRNMTSLSSDFTVWGHWGDHIRILEKVVGTTITQNGIYSVHITGIRTR